MKIKTLNTILVSVGGLFLAVYSLHLIPIFLIWPIMIIIFLGAVLSFFKKDINAILGSLTFYVIGLQFLNESFRLSSFILGFLYLLVIIGLFFLLFICLMKKSKKNRS